MRSDLLPRLLEFMNPSTSPRLQLTSPPTPQSSPAQWRSAYTSAQSPAPSSPSCYRPRHTTPSPNANGTTDSQPPASPGHAISPPPVQSTSCGCKSTRAYRKYLDRWASVAARAGPGREPGPGPLLRRLSCTPDCSTPAYSPDRT